MVKRSSLFGSSNAPAAPKPAEPAPALVAAPVPSTTAAGKYPVAKTREGKRVATVYLDPAALKALQRLAIDEDTSLQALLVEGVNAVFQARGMSRIA